jgi:hypothetical protein
MRTYRESRHARIRAQQRSVTRAVRSAHSKYADRFSPAGRGATSVTVSRTSHSRMLADGVHPDLARKVSRLAVVEADNGNIITYVVMYQRRGKSYRNG